MKATLKRTAQNDSGFRGTVIMSVEVDCDYHSPLAQKLSNKVLDSINEELNENYVPCFEESDHYDDGFSLVFYVDCGDVDYFRDAWKVAKKVLNNKAVIEEKTTTENPSDSKEEENEDMYLSMKEIENVVDTFNNEGGLSLQYPQGEGLTISIDSNGIDHFNITAKHESISFPLCKVSLRDANRWEDDQAKHFVCEEGDSRIDNQYYPNTCKDAVDGLIYKTEVAKLVALTARSLLIELNK